MTDQNKSNQAVRELKQLDAKEPDPSIINIWQLRGRNVNDELHTHSIRQPPPGPICVLRTEQTLYQKNLSLLPPICHSTPASVGTILPKSSSNLDADQGKTINETLGKVACSIKHY